MFHVVPLKEKISRARKSSAYFFAIFIFSISELNCQTVMNFSQWRNFSSVTKSIYIAGAMDGLTQSYEQHPEVNLLFSQISACLNELQIDVGEVVAMVDNFYLNNKNWAYSPHKAIEFQLVNGHCSMYTFPKH